MPARKTVSSIVARYWRKLYEKEGYTIPDIQKMSINLGYYVSLDTVTKILASVNTYFRRPGRRKAR